MDERKAFEAWATSADSPILAGMPWDSEPVRYMWAAWQSATLAERERCAKVCDRYTEGRWLAEAIRKG